jgi:peptidyl-prolyl cis-trans isomerase SurA
MKRAVSLFCFLAFLPVCFAQSNDPILMKIAGKDVTKSEFEYVWNKNNTKTALDKRSPGEYVDLFVNFKLKVAEAESQGIDTTQAFISELAGYRRQLIAPYLTDKEAEEALVKLCYDRFREYVEVSHLLLKVSSDATPEDTLRIYRKVMGLYQRILKGEDFAKLAEENSEDDSKKNGGYLGFTTGLRSVFPFENGIFNTPVGKYSVPFRTQFGYHIVKVISRRPANGGYRSAHIMKAVSAKASPEEQAAAKDSIFEIYNALKSGGDFTKFATQQSDDKVAAERNGEYGLKYCGSLPIEYEDNVYKLKVGDFSEPFHSKYGWHIVKALEFQPYPSMEKMRNEINGYISQNECSKAGRKSLVERLKKEYNYTFIKENFNAFVKAGEQLRATGDSAAIKALAVSEAPLFKIGEQSISQKSFAAALAQSPKASNNLGEAYANYVQGKILAYEDSHLESKYPEFGRLMQEYRDGLLLFEVSNREVWEKASQDTAGLANYFAENKDKYNWEKPHYKGFIILCANAAVAKKAKKIAGKLPADSLAVVLKRTFNNNSVTLVKVQRGLFAQGENVHVDFLAFKQAKPEETNKNFPKAFLKGYILQKGPESYTDVCGLVVSDYQNYLEEKWIQHLKGKYKVVIDKDVLNTVNKN